MISRIKDKLRKPVIKTGRQNHLIYTGKANTIMRTDNKDIELSDIRLNETYYILDREYNVSDIEIVYSKRLLGMKEEYTIRLEPILRV